LGIVASTPLEATCLPCGSNNGAEAMNRHSKKEFETNVSKKQ